MKRSICIFVAGSMLLAVALAQSNASIAEACATFGPLRDPGRAPSLELERVLIVHDPAVRVQHFIREVVFAGDAKSFGFVVPTPAIPQVFTVADPPFDRLEEAFPFTPRPKPREPSAVPRGTRMAGVEVIEQKRVGSFKSFVLRATDATALANWLRDNELGSTAENDAWLASYVARDFYYVAMRYEPLQQVKSSKLESEAVRITFESPLAYYPYEEPLRAKGKKGAKRALAIWLVAPQHVVPVAFERRGQGGGWVRPFQAGARADAVPAERVRVHLRGSEASALDHSASQVVHTFEDQKSVRDGLGDVVFLPAAGVEPAVEAFIARVSGEAADIQPLLQGAGALAALPLRATAKGQRFDPNLRARLAPKRTVTYARRYQLSDDF